DGAARPGHFRGVCTVVSKLFHIIQPDRAYFGEKDAQQLAIIKKMAFDLNFGVQVIGCPIVRESDGLAKSSRNTYLNAAERAAAPVLFRAIEHGKNIIKKGMPVQTLISEMENVLAAEPLAKTEYVAVVDAMTMQPVDTIEGAVLVPLAVRVGSTRLIDNFSFTPQA
ncbi:MAG: pantoate--beta-alanine ligase, partial [Ottowia sp.]|nr:pantoate--beta-alanine ligase [Ottowia sp.]